MTCSGPACSPSPRGRGRGERSGPGQHQADPDARRATNPCRTRGAPADRPPRPNASSRSTGTPVRHPVWLGRWPPGPGFCRDQRGCAGGHGGRSGDRGGVGTIMITSGAVPAPRPYIITGVPPGRHHAATQDCQDPLAVPTSGAHQSREPWLPRRPSALPLYAGIVHRWNPHICRWCCHDKPGMGQTGVTVPRTRSKTSSGRSGDRSICAPKGLSASATALNTAAGALIVPASPIPF